MCTQPRGGALSLMFNTLSLEEGVYTGNFDFSIFIPSPLEVPPLWWTGVHWQTQIISQCDLGPISP